MGGRAQAGISRVVETGKRVPRLSTSLGEYVDNRLHQDGGWDRLSHVFALTAGARDAVVAAVDHEWNAPLSLPRTAMTTLGRLRREAVQPLPAWGVNAGGEA